MAPNMSRQYWYWMDTEYEWNWWLQTLSSEGEGGGRGGGGSLLLGRQLHGALLLTVSAVSTDLHKCPRKAGPLIIVGNCKLQSKLMENGEQDIFYVWKPGSQHDCFSWSWHFPWNVKETRYSSSLNQLDPWVVLWNDNLKEFCCSQQRNYSRNFLENFKNVCKLYNYAK